VPNAIESETLLLVEGNDHRNFFEAFRDHLAIPEMQIENYGGVSQLSGVLAAYASSREFGTVRRLGIVRDAESSAVSAFQSVRSALHRANLALPERIGAVATGDPMVGVLVLPDDGPGMLETVLARCFAETREDDCIERFFQCVKADGRTILRSEKARTCAYLATTRDPHVSVGVAAKKGVWDFKHDGFSNVREFLSRLGSP
jgi:hypothetical protein